MEAVHERRKALVVFAQPARGVKHPRIEKRIEAQQPAPELCLQVLTEPVAQAVFSKFQPSTQTLRRRQGRNGAGEPTLTICSASSASRPARQWRKRNRSEERRVGKECRSRWSPYH